MVLLVVYRVLCNKSRPEVPNFLDMLRLVLEVSYLSSFFLWELIYLVSVSSDHTHHENKKFGNMPYLFLTLFICFLAEYQDRDKSHFDT
jgi:TRAP-type mannitol/chloroaromatic compound transport system permease large subunit